MEGDEACFFIVQRRPTAQIAKENRTANRQSYKRDYSFNFVAISLENVSEFIVTFSQSDDQATLVEDISLS